MEASATAAAAATAAAPAATLQSVFNLHSLLLAAAAAEFFLHSFIAYLVHGQI